MHDISTLIINGETDWKQYGDVNAVKHPDNGMILFNYTQQCQWKSPAEWNWFERHARGLIFDAEGTVVARPFRKFWNYGQVEPSADSSLLSVAEKMDGSLGILYWDGKEPHVATRGSFTSDQALWASEYLRNYADDARMLRASAPTVTWLFEIIYPDNRVVVDYGGEQGLWLIGGIDRIQGWDLTEDELDSVAMRLKHIRRPKIYHLYNLEDALAAVKVMTAHQEGLVLRFSDGERYKVKGDAYLLAHRIMTGCNFKRVLTAVEQGKYEEMIEGVPDEFLDMVKRYRHEIERECLAIESGIDLNLKLAPDGDRKAFALWVQANYPKEQWRYFFARKDGKDIRPLIYRYGFENREDDVQAEPTGEENDA